MQMKTVKVSAGRTVPHPHQAYSNMKFHVELSAELRKGEDATSATTLLQQIVDGLLSAECDRRLADIERKIAEEREAREAAHKKQQAIWDAEREVRDAQAKLDQLRTGEPEADEIPF